MKKLSNLKLSEAKVMDVHEMKAITGGQYGGSNTCRNTGTSTGLYGDTANVVCEGECPPAVQTGAFGEPGPIQKQTCRKSSFTSNGNTLVTCVCM